VLELKKEHLLLFLSPFLVIGSILLTCYYFERIEFEGYYYTAPDGEYDILLSRVDYEESVVYFVLCPSSGSELHGDFKFKEGLVFPSDYWGWLTVKLENQIITEVRFLH